MIGDEENIGFDLNSKEDGFRYYKIMVKVMGGEKVQDQNLEVYTSGLQSLLEMRRIHSIAFSKFSVDNVREN